MNMKNGLDSEGKFSPHTRTLNLMEFIFLAEFLLYFLSWGSCPWWSFDWQLSGQTLSTHALGSGINYHHHRNYQWEGSGRCGLRGPRLQLLNPCWHTHTHITTSPSPLCTLYSWKSAVSYSEIYPEDKPHRHTPKGAFWIIYWQGRQYLNSFLSKVEKYSCWPWIIQVINIYASLNFMLHLEAKFGVNRYVLFNGQCWYIRCYVDI